jgi:hypothetical protein
MHASCHGLSVASGLNLQTSPNRLDGQGNQQAGTPSHELDHGPTDRSIFVHANDTAQDKR